MILFNFRVNSEKAVFNKYNSVDSMSSIKTQKLLGNTPQGLEGYIREIKSDPDLIVEISVTEDYFSNGSSNQGIELLKWCRLKRIKKHIILRSNQSLIELLKENPKNAIIATKGVTLLKMKEEVPDDDLEEADFGQLREIFKLDFDLKEIKHDEANWFALRKLWEHHSQVSGDVIPSLPNDDQMLHAVFDFVFREGQAGIRPAQLKKAETQLRNLQSLYCNKSAHRIIGCEKYIVFVDDKADGWDPLLKAILGIPENKSNFKTIVPNANSTEAEVFNQVKDFIDDNFPEWWKSLAPSHHIYISDLKLLRGERNETNYTKLLSYKTVKRLRSEYEDRLRIMYFTASNDLSKVRGMLDDRLYNPQVIYTKEGADQGLSEFESFNKYIELLDSLFRVLKGYAKKSIANIQILNLTEEVKKEKFLADYLEFLFLSLNQDSSTPDKFSSLGLKIIYIDTNMFLEPKFAKSLITLLLTKRAQVKILATVRHEISCIAENKEQNRGIEEILAVFFLKLIDSLKIEIDYNNLSEADKAMADKEFCEQLGVNHHRPDFADDQFEKVLQNDRANRILFCKDSGLIKRIPRGVTIYKNFDFLDPKSQSRFQRNKKPFRPKKY